MTSLAEPVVRDGRVATDLLTFDPADVAARFDREPFLIGHRLADHPLLQLPRLIELARTLPEESVEYNAGSVGIDQRPELTPRTGLSIEETLRQIETCGSWMVLKDVEHDPEYRQLLDACLDAIKPEIDRVAPGMCRRHAFIFVSSPGATTPYHVDYELNFLLHVRGDKTMTVWNGQDRDVMSEGERERILTGGQRNLPYRDEFAAKAWVFQLRPGMGVHVPLSSPHHVKVGDKVSISFSITFLTDDGQRVRALHRTNAFLRRLGWKPRDVGISKTGDAVKFLGFRIADFLARIRARLLAMLGRKAKTQASSQRYA
ncbi:MAG TPA: hypothetical protein VHC92_03265 [Rhodanobacteraceae bacterium]|jgi:hypothetical protein|nr:hypothetical protein [Rhodanobacteraceae bacterium]